MKDINGSIWREISTQRVMSTEFICVIGIKSQEHKNINTFIKSL